MRARNTLEADAGSENTKRYSQKENIIWPLTFTVFSLFVVAFGVCVCVCVCFFFRFCALGFRGNKGTLCKFMYIDSSTSRTDTRADEAHALVSLLTSTVEGFFFVMAQIAKSTTCSPLVRATPTTQITWSERKLSGVIFNGKVFNCRAKWRTVVWLFQFSIMLGYNVAMK